MNTGLRTRLVVVILLGLVALQGAFAPLRFTGWTPGLRRPRLTAHLGLDLVGGTRIVLQARGTASAPLTPENVDAVVRVIANRVDQIGVTEPVIQRLGERRIAVELPGIQDPQRAIALIGKTALLEFVATGATQLPMGARWSADGSTVTPPAPGRPFALRKTVVLTGAGLADVHAVFDPSSAQPVVQFRFGGQAARTLEAFTGAHVGEYLTIVLDNEVISSPVIRSRLTGGSGQISGGFRSLPEAHDLAVLLRGGALPLPVDVVESRTVGPLLGQDAIQASLRAGMVAALAVALFMALYYGIPGLLADAALGVYVLLVLAALAALHATLTLPGIVGFILSVGMAVDANVIIFEKVKEELRGGRTAAAALATGWRRAYATIADANVTTLLAAAVLFALGSGAVRGFAVTLAVGVLASMLTAIVVTRVFIDTGWAAGLRAPITALGRTPPGEEGAAARARPLWDLMGRRRLGYALSLLVILPGVVALILNAASGRGALNWGVDFTGGSFVQVRFPQPVPLGAVRTVVRQVAPGESVIQQSGRDVLIRTRTLPGGGANVLAAALRARIGPLSVLQSDQVGPTIGRELRSSTLVAVLLGLGLQVIYLAVRFRSIRYAIAADAALLHDLLVVVGVFALTRLEINAWFIAVLLTVIGYSINDTVVVFDRIRENVGHVRLAFDRLVNRSVFESLVRSVNTALTTILAVGAIYAFGGAGTRALALGLMVGVLTGGYSSVLNACPVLVDWSLRRPPGAVAAAAGAGRRPEAPRGVHAHRRGAWPAPRRPGRRPR